MRIESVDLIRSLFPAQQNLLSSVAATYIAELADTFAAEKDPAELTYRLLDRTTEALLEGVPSLPLVAYAEIWMLRLAGILPSLRSCIECGTPLGRPLRFDPAREGFVCDGCGGRDAFVIDNEVTDALDALFRLPSADFALRRWDERVLFEIRSLAGTVRRNFLGHELKSFEVLTGILGSHAR